ncbi:MAG: prolipoprotein diacylglyceryl transferase, partial [bacterium]
AGMLGEAVPWWAIKYPAEAVNVPSGWVHPAPLYAFLYCAAIAAIIYGVIRKRPRTGVAALLWLTLYPAARFSQEFVRGDVVRGFIYRGEELFLSTSQFLSIIIFLAAVAGWIIIFRRPPQKFVTADDLKPKQEDKEPAPKQKQKKGKPGSGKGGAPSKTQKKKTNK